MFIRYAEPDREVMERLTRTLPREKITIWTERSDIKKRMSFQEKLHRGMAIALHKTYTLIPLLVMDGLIITLMEMEFSNISKYFSCC